MSFQGPIIIHVPQRDPLIHDDLHKLAEELASVATVVNDIAGAEILRVQGGGRSLYVVVRDPRESVEGFSYMFEINGCARTRIGSSERDQPDALDWNEACEHITFRLRLLLNTISARLTARSATARAAAHSIRLAPEAQTHHNPV